MFLENFLCNFIEGSVLGDFSLIFHLRSVSQLKVIVSIMCEPAAGEGC